MKDGDLMAIERAEYQKVEPTFEVNRFERPLELTQVEAWTRLVLRILFMEKGTMPSDPNMGCNITAETYQDIETLKGTIRKNLDKQVRSYLPDIPFAGMEVFTEAELVSDGDPQVVYYIIGFQQGATNIATVKVASRAKNRVIDFKIQF